MTDYVAQVAVAGTVTNIWVFQSPISLVGGNLVVSGGQTFVPPGGTQYFIQSGAQRGWTVSGGVLIPPTYATPSYTDGNLSDYAGRKAKSILGGGFTATISSVAYEFATDPISLGLLNLIVTRLGQASPPSTVTWPFANGTATLSAANFLIAATALLNWTIAVQAELAAVNSGLGLGFTTPAAIEAASWPAPTYP